MRSFRIIWLRQLNSKEIQAGVQALENPNRLVGSGISEPHSQISRDDFCKGLVILRPSRKSGTKKRAKDRHHPSGYDVPLTTSLFQDWNVWLSAFPDYRPTQRLPMPTSAISSARFGLYGASVEPGIVRMRVRFQTKRDIACKHINLQRL
jgi:hypothetical protein